MAAEKYGEGVRSRQKRLRPAQILDAAFHEFTEKGYAAARVEDVARRIGVTKGTIYVYFPTKAALFKETIRTHIVPVFDRMDDTVREVDLPAIELLRLYLQAGYAEIVGNPQSRELMRLMISDGGLVPELVDFFIEELMDKGNNTLRAIVAKGVEQGAFDAEIVARIQDFPDIVIGPAIVVSITQMMLGDRFAMDVPRYLQAHLDLILRGLCVRSATS
jgi:AcrR family transcriptional regulator